MIGCRESVVIGFGVSQCSDRVQIVVASYGRTGVAKKEQTLVVSLPVMRADGLITHDARGVMT